MADQLISSLGAQVGAGVPLGSQRKTAQTAGGFSAVFQQELEKAEGRQVAFSKHAMARAEERGREFKFSILVPAREYFPQAGEAEILLQGVIDAWFDGGDGITVIDFKSDRVRPGQEKGAAERHRAQIEAYSKAMARIMGRPVRRKVLWFFATNTPVEL